MRLRCPGLKLAGAAHPRQALRRSSPSPLRLPPPLCSLHPQPSCAGTAPVDLGKCVSHISSHHLVLSKAIVQVGDDNLHQLFKEAGINRGGACSLSLAVGGEQSMRRIHTRLDKVLTEMLMELQESASPCDDLLHGLLSEQEAQEALSMDEVKGTLFDIVAGGTHTTALALEWAMAELLRNLHCFHHLQREIDEQISKEHIGRDERVWPNANEFMPKKFEGSCHMGEHTHLLTWMKREASATIKLL